MYQRRKNIITNTQTNEKEVCKSINEAKRKSRKIQLETDGALGRGSVTKSK